MTLITCQRDAYNIPRDIAYLNCAYESPLSNAVVAAGHEGIREKAQPWGTFPEDFFTHPDAARKLFAQIINADSEGVAIIPSVSYGMTAAIKNLPTSKGEEILVLKDQFPSNIYPWRKLAEGTGASVRMLSRSSNGPTWGEVICDAITDATTVVAVPHCHWVDGAMVDLDAVAAKARAHGAALVLDITQSAGALPINVSAIEPDFAICACYKWLMGPYSIGFMWVHPKWRKGTPVEEGWIARKGAQDFARLVDYQDEYEPGARRFDMGERSQFQLLPMAAAGMKQLLDWGVENIATTLGARSEDTAARAAKYGFRSLPVGTRAGHYLGLIHDDGLPDRMVERMIQHNVYISVRGPSVRVTPHLYVTDEDVDRLMDALAKELGSA